MAAEPGRAGSGRAWLDRAGPDLRTSLFMASYSTGADVITSLIPRRSDLESRPGSRRRTAGCTIRLALLDRISSAASRACARLLSFVGRYRQGRGRRNG